MNGTDMPPNEDNERLSMSRWEIDKEREHAVITEKLRQFDTMIPKIFETLESVEKSISKMPLEIHTCRERMATEQKEYMHKEFVTTAELVKFESKFEGRIGAQIESINKKIGRASWLLSGFIAAAIAFVWVLTHTNLEFLS